MDFMLREIINWSLPIVSIMATFITAITGIYTLRKNFGKRDSTKKLNDEPQLDLGTENIESNAVFKFEKIDETKNARISFESSKLSEYYSQVLSQSKISFWFSLIFASIGFTVIIFGAFTYTSDKMSGSLISILSGVVIDSISALFFVQSKSAQKSMSEFFEKLRQDRSRVDSKDICESIIDNNAKDAIKVQLSLHLAGIAESKQIAQEIIKDCLRKEN